MYLGMVFFIKKCIWVGYFTCFFIENTIYFKNTPPSYKKKGVFYT